MTKIFTNPIPLFVFFIHTILFEMTSFARSFTSSWSISPHLNISFIRAGPLPAQVTLECPLPGPVLGTSKDAVFAE